MGGTWATYQGIPCADVLLRRSRGWQADTSEVLIHASALLELEEPRGRTAKPRTQDRPPADELATRLAFKGALELREEVEGRSWPLRVEDLYVLAVEAVREGGKVTAYRVTLADERYFWPRGLLERHAFNRRSASGEVRPDSLKLDGTPWTLAEIVADQIAPKLAPAGVGDLPADWAGRPADTLEFRPLEAAAAALTEIVDREGLEEPCLRWDRKLSLHEAGAGAVGVPEVAADGAATGPNRDGTVEDGLRLWDGGAGQRRLLQLGWPEEHAVVVGGQTIVTAQVEDWEPVLRNARGEFVLLDEAVVRKLTGGRYGLEWLQRIVLQPAAHQNAEGVRPADMALLRSQAYRLYRLPRVASKDGKPGPNAHLLPLLARAEVEDGRRLPVTVEAYRFATVTRATDVTREATAFEAAQRALANTRQAIREHPNARQLVAYPVGELPPLQNVSPQDLDNVRAASSEVGTARGVSADLGAQLDRGWADVFRAADEANGTVTADLYRIAREIDQAQLGVPGGSPAQVEALNARVQKLTDELRAIDERAGKAKAEGERARTTGRPPQTALPGTYYVNVDRAVDEGASVVSAEAGVIQTGDLAGWLEKERVHDAGMTRLVPKPVRVTFGAVLRPRLDIPQPRLWATASGAVNLNPPGTRTSAQAVRDHETWFRAAYRRVARGQAEGVEVSDEVLRLGTRIDRPDLVWLAPLDERAANANLRLLKEAALAAAKALFRKPDHVGSTTATLARPLPVNPDGVVASTTIRMRHKGGVPCGFETTVVTGSSAFRLGAAGTRQRPQKKKADDDREGLRP